MIQKILLVLLVLSFHIQPLQAQEIVFQENFQKRIISEEIGLINRDGQVPLPEPMGKTTNAWAIVSHPGDPGRFFAATSSRFGNGIQADRWLILPQIRLPENGVLRWDIRSSSINPATWEDYQVLISENGKDPDIDFKVLFEETAPYSDRSFEAFTMWSKRELDLHAYSGKDVYIAFRAVGKDGFLLFLDEISVTGLSSLSISLEKTSALKYNLPGDVRIQGTLFNSGRDQVHTFDAHVEDEKGNILAHTTFRDLTIDSNRSFDFEFPTFDLGKDGNHKIFGVISNPNGQKAKAEQIHRGEVDIVIISESASRKILAEFYTGTWCGHCPKGVLNMKRVLAANPDVIPVFIHHRDGFAIPEADSLISFMPNGYPSTTFDRFNIWGTNRPAITNYNDNSYEKAVEIRRQAPSPVMIDITHSFEPGSGLLNIRVNARFVAETTGDFRLNLMLVEDNLYSQVYDQQNFANADPNWPELNNLGNPIPNYRHDFVLRHLANGPWGAKGIIPLNPVVNEEYSFTYSIELSKDWKPENISIISYVAEHYEVSHVTEVLNALQVELTDALSEVELQQLNALYEEFDSQVKIPAPGFSLQDIHGNMVNLSDFLGKVVYIDFWATWCMPCRAEIPHLNHLKAELKDNKDIVIIGISTDAVKDKDKWKQLLQELNMGDVQLFAGEDAKIIMSDYNVRSIPHFTIISKDGSIFKNMTIRPSNPLIKQLLIDLAG